MIHLAVVKTLSELLEYSHKFDITPIAFFQTDEYRNVTVQTTQLDRYKKVIEPYIKEYAVSYDQREAFKYRPDLLSARIYGTPVLAWFIMTLNGTEAPSRFIVRKNIKLVDPSTLENIFIELKSKDIERVAQNHKDNGIL